LFEFIEQQICEWYWGFRVQKHFSSYHEG